MATAMKTLFNRPGFSCRENAKHQAASSAQKPLAPSGHLGKQHPFSFLCLRYITILSSCNGFYTGNIVKLFNWVHHNRDSRTAIQRLLRYFFSWRHCPFVQVHQQFLGLFVIIIIPQTLDHIISFWCNCYMQPVVFTIRLNRPLTSRMRNHSTALIRKVSRPPTLWQSLMALQSRTNLCRR